MENIILFDDDSWVHLLPLTYTRPICELRLGILTIREKWERWLQGKASYITQDYLAEKYPIHITASNLVINATFLPNDRLARLVKQLDDNEAILLGEELVAARMDEQQFDRLMREVPIQELKGIDIQRDIDIIERVLSPVDIFQRNGVEIEKDFALLTKGRTSQEIPADNQVVRPDRVFIEAGARVTASVLNASKGPIYIGRQAEVMEGCMIRGGLAMCAHSALKMGAKIYGPTTIGPWSKVGGEVNNSVFTSHANKAHDGFLGNAVIGAWCNLGADTNNSNLKNNYADVKLWSYAHERFVDTGSQFCGLIMGDHSKCGINTMFNTGTVVGVSANIFGSGFPRNFIPSYTWGGASGFTTYQFRKSIETAQRVMARRDQTLLEADKRILGHIFHQSAKYRPWEE